MKQLLKRLTALFLCLCLAVCVLPVTSAAAAPPDWAADYYKTLEARSILGYYKTSGAITRYEFVELLVNLLNGAVPRTKLTPYPAKDWNYFADSSGYPVLYGAAYGILEGEIGSDGRRYSKGDDYLTREQAAKMVCSLLDFFSDELGHTVKPSDSPAVYRDAAKISDWARPFTERVASYGVMKGDELGNFDPQGKLEWPAAVTLGSRTLKLLDSALEITSALLLQSNMDWSSATSFGAEDNSVARPMTGWQQNYYTIDNGDGTASALIVRTSGITVERFNSNGSLAETRVLERELSTFGAFFDSGEHYYLAFGQSFKMGGSEDSSKEVWRIVQYDKSWNRLGSLSASAKETYTTGPFRSAVARMAVSEDGKTVTLYAARTRTDGHQSNITFIMNTSPFSFREIWGKLYPDNHVSHSFGQFVRYDGDTMVTVDHGDAYPRSFVFQDGKREADLFELAYSGKAGDNVTHAIGSGFEVTQDGYLFLGCSTPQQDFNADKTAPWNVFLSYLGKSGENVTLTWLTNSEASINTARLVKLDENSLVAMWGQNGDVHWQKLDGKGNLVGAEQVMEAAPMPTTQPVAVDGDICWIQTSELPQYRGSAILYRINID